jgi:hypothetical protein
MKLVEYFCCRSSARCLFRSPIPEVTLNEREWAGYTVWKLSETKLGRYGRVQDGSDEEASELVATSRDRGLYIERGAVGCTLTAQRE